MFSGCEMTSFYWSWFQCQICSMSGQYGPLVALTPVLSMPN